MRKLIMTFSMALIVLFSVFSLPSAEEYDADLWPEREITVICPWAVGGVADIVNRSLSPYLQEELGVPVLATNELGAGGNVALTNYIMGDSDPYELILGGEGGFAISPNIEGSDAIAFSYDDFEPVINFYSAIMVLTADSSLGISNLEDIKEYAASHRLTVAVNGVTGAEGFLVRALFDELGLDYVLVNYNGANLALAAAARGETSLAVSHQSQALASVESGVLTPVLVFDGKRSDNPPFQDVPCLGELGYDTYFPNTCELLVRKGTDEKIVKKLQDAYLAAFERPEMKELYDTLLIEMDPMPGHEYDKHIENVREIVRGTLE